jgi:hypothetical protein
MSKLFDRIEARCDRFRKLDDLSSNVAFKVTLSSPVFDPAKYLEKYVASLQMVVPFWIDPQAAGGQYKVSESFKTAKRTMAYALFEDTRLPLLKIRRAMDAGDRREMEIALAELEDSFRGD